MMKALVVDTEKGLMLSVDHVKPQRKPNEALVRVTRVGVCNTDLEILKGYYGFKGTLGHEFLGVIEEASDNSHLKVGTRVVGEINIACENCQICTDGGIQKRNHCPNRTVLGILNKDGTFAEYLTLPDSNLFAVPDSLTDEQATFCEPLAAAFRIVEQVTTIESDVIAVIGDGKLGNLIAQVMSTQPHSKITLFGKHQVKLDKVPQKGIEKVIVNDETASKFSDLYDISIEASGTPSGIIMAGSMTKPLGKIVLKSTCAAGAKGFDTTPFVVKELQIIGSRCGNFEMALKALESQKVKVDHLIDKVFSLNEGLDAIKAAGVKGTMKIQIKM